MINVFPDAAVNVVTPSKAYISPSNVIEAVSVLPASKVAALAVPDVPPVVPTPAIAMVPVPPDALISTFPRSSEEPISPPISIAPAPDERVKVSLPVASILPVIVMPPSRVVLEAVSVSMVVLAPSSNFPVIVTVPKSVVVLETVLIFPFVTVFTPLRLTALISVLSVLLV